MDMPRARTQSGRPVCMATLRLLAVVSHDAPPRNMTGTASHSVWMKAMAAMVSAFRAAPPCTSWSRVQRARSLGSHTDEAMAPAPMDASSTVNVLAPPPSKPLATRASSAMRAVE
jgi:hypothetical protein